jgi:glycosyltransferase involved in cell wall biosynthesis
VSERPLLYVLERYPELSQTFVEGELRELGRLGVSTRVVALAPGRSTGEPSAAAVRYPAPWPERVRAAARRPAVAPAVLRERHWPPDRRRARGALRIAPWVADAGAARHLHAHFASEATDVARLLAGLARRPFSFTAHATDAFRDGAALRANLAAAAFCVTGSDYARRQLVEVAPEHAAKVEVLGMGVDLERFERRRPYAADGPIVAVGRLVPKKGFERLVRAARDLGEREVLVAGDGPERERLHSIVAETHAPVRLLGALPHAEVRELVEGAALFVLPCVVAPDGDRDGAPAAVIEAMALEVPVVTSDAVGLPELVGSDRGRLAPAGDVAALRSAIDAVLALPAQERVAMGRAGRAWAERHADSAALARRLLDRIDAAAAP